MRPLLFFSLFLLFFLGFSSVQPVFFDLISSLVPIFLFSVLLHFSAQKNQEAAVIVEVRDGEADGRLRWCSRDDD